MLQLLRFLIFGKRCNHEWKLEKSLEPFNNHELHLYICQECGRMKKVRLRIKTWESSTNNGII